MIGFQRTTSRLTKIGGNRFPIYGRTRKFGHGKVKELSKEESVDVLIVGSGPVGSTFARKLASAGRSVYMVDAGAVHTERPGAHMKNSYFFQRNINQFTPIVSGQLLAASVPTSASIVPTLDPIAFHKIHTPGHLPFILNNQNPEQNPYVNLDGAAVVYAVGGMGTHWTCATPRQHPTLERSRIISDKEWSKLYDEAESLLLTHNDSFDNSIRHTLVKEQLQEEYDELEGAWRPQHLPLSGYRRKDNPELMHWGSAADVLGPLLDGVNSKYSFTLRPECLVKKLVPTSDGSAIDHVVIRDLQYSKDIKIHANLVVVAGGAILTPQILFNSNIRPQALGKYLVEQPLAFTQVIMKESLVEKARDDERFCKIVAEHQAKYPRDPLPFPFNDPDPQLYIPVSEGRPWHCQVHRDSFAFGAVRSNLDSRTVVDFRWFGTISPHEDNHVTFSEKLKDTMGMPQPSFRYVLNDQEKEQNHRMMQDMLRAATSVGGFLPESLPQMMKPGTALHIMGTTRMGHTDDGTSVVDEYSKVWGIKNLYLGGNGVIPTGAACNPTLTSVALAVRSADKIIEKSSSDI